MLRRSRLFNSFSLVGKSSLSVSQKTTGELLLPRYSLCDTAALKQHKHRGKACIYSTYSTHTHTYYAFPTEAVLTSLRGTRRGERFPVAQLVFCEPHQQTAQRLLQRKKKKKQLISTTNSPNQNQLKQPVKAVL